MIERAGESSSLSESVVAAEAPDVRLQQRKSKKTRRGKKKKLRYEDDDSPVEALMSPSNNNCNNNVTDVTTLLDVGTTNVENIEDIAVSTPSSDLVSSSGSRGGVGFGTPYETPEKTKIGREQAKNRTYSSRSCLLRPTDVPKAPENSTQFIIDDHEDCNLYFSFERNKNLSGSANESEDGEEGCCRSPAFAGFRDIDYEYESPDDLVTSARFYEQDFENIYRHAREDELLSKPRDVIMHQYLELEQRVLELEARVAPKMMSSSKVDPAIMIVQLQEELLRLQEENSALRSEKRTLLVQEEVDLDLVEVEDINSATSPDEENVEEERTVETNCGVGLEQVPMIIDNVTSSSKTDEEIAEHEP